MKQTKKMLISGASFAGLTTAYRLNKMGYKVTIVEIGGHLKMGGTPIKGLVALVGDSVYCASPAAGMGGSLAIIGATSLADAFGKYNGNIDLAINAYNNDLRPYIE